MSHFPKAIVNKWYLSHIPGNSRQQPGPGLPSTPRARATLGAPVAPLWGTTGNRQIL